MNACSLITLLFISNYATSSTSNVLEHQISKTLQDEQLVGIVWSTISGDSISVGSEGFSNKAQSSVMAESQKIHVGSVTKTVLALGVMRLITQGKLSLDTNVEKLLPQLSFDNSWRNSNAVTVKNLLEHTAGLDNIRMWQFLSTIPTADTPLQNIFPSNNENILKIRTEPGTQYSYSNMGYALLAMVIEAVIRVRYEDYLDETLLKPLGMQDSTFKFVSQEGIYADSALAMGYFENSVAQVALPGYLRPAGQFTTTAPDMAKLMKLILNEGILNGKAFISLGLINRLGYPQGTDANNVGLDIGHGLALAIRDRHNVLGMCQPGETFGFRAYICLFPEDKKAFFYAINTDSESANYEQFNSLFIQALSIKESSIEQPEPQVMDIEKLQGVYLPSPNNMAEFEWIDLVFNFKWLVVEDNKVIMKSLQANDRKLIPLNKYLLRATDRNKASHGIIIDENQNVFISDGLNTFQKQPVLTVTAYWVSLILGISGFLYIILMSLVRSVTRDFQRLKVIGWPLVNLFGFSIPVYFYYNQSFLKFGELTAASISLAIVSGLLPLTLLVAIFIGAKKVKTQRSLEDVVASFMLLQLCLVLIYWDLLPTIFWR
ncbi:MAG: beta-lactamase family protein [Pseudomonadales bacterium]|nr:beta-lactamase family protein [Pseudomonadales bacterium]